MGRTAASLGQPILDPGEAAGELLIGGAQSGFGIDVQVAGEVGHDEKEIADLLGQVGVGEGVAGLDHLAGLFDQLVEDLIGGGPVKADAGGAVLEFQSAGQGGKGSGDAVKGAGGPTLFRLRGFPVAGLLRSRLVAGLVAKDMGVAGDHLVADRGDDIGEGEMARLGCHLRLVDGLEEKVAKLSLQLAPGLALDGVCDLMRLL